MPTLWTANDDLTGGQSGAEPARQVCSTGTDQRGEMLQGLQFSNPGVGEIDRASVDSFELEKIVEQLRFSI